jgi:hypothetical protein
LFARRDQLVCWDAAAREEACAEIVRSYRRQYGDQDVGHFAEWAGLGRAHARELWGLAGEKMGRRAALRGLKLLGPGDPVLLGRDREALVPDAAMRKKGFAGRGSMGAVLSDGEVVAGWRGRKKGSRLEVELEGRVDVEAVRRELERLAPHRGCTTVSLK